MNRPAILLLGLLLFAGCTGDRWVRTTVVNEDEMKIYLEHRVEDDIIKEQHFDHPFQFNPKELKAILKGLEYKEPRILKKDEQVRVFYDLEVATLTPALAKVMSSANSKQRVRFVSFNLGRTLIFSSPRKTEGVMFLEKGGLLNIAFSFINEDMDLDDRFDQTATYQYRDPMRIQSSRTPLVPKEWYTHATSAADGRLCPLWVVVDLKKTGEMYAGTPPPEAGITTMEKPAEEAAKPTPEEVEEKPAPAETKGADQTLKDKLKFLQDLYNEGLIDEEEYKAKKKELLEKFK